MKNRKILFPAAAGIVIALIILAVTLTGPPTKTVTVVFEGQPIEVSTSAREVSGALEELGFSPKPEDEIEPAANTRLEDGQTITYTPAIQVNLNADGESFTLITPERTPSAWLAETGIDLAAEDRLTINGQRALPEQPIGYLPVVDAEVRRAVTIDLHSNAGQWRIRSAAPTLGQALWEAGFNFTVSDVLTPAPETPLNESLTAQLQSGQQIIIQVDGQSLTATTSADTVGTALAQAGLSLQGLDYSIPAQNEPLPPDGQVTVVRVQEEIIINQETIPFETVFTALDDVEIDSYQVKQVGQVGLKGQRVRVRYENSEEIERVVEDEWVL
ncbi:MAG TPA: ubiquitin-like domain-containing protein, partial [Anaerolineales bacterium]|nr:ubiquitin-like domain-containing protein [Anaerolineales bacterium]